MFNDILLESDGRSATAGNGLVKDSDIYGNSFSDCWDDAMEVERGDENVRVWGNYFTRIFKGISAGYVWKGPLYVWNNVAEGFLEPHKESGQGADTLPRRVATFLIPSQEKKAVAWNSIVYLFHNTVRCVGKSDCATLAVGNGYDVYDSEHPRLVSRNNVWQTEEWAVPGGVFTFYLMKGQYLDQDFDLHNGAFGESVPPGPHSLTGEARFDANGALMAGTPGDRAAVRLPGFNRAGADMGAVQPGEKPEYGAKLWSVR